MLVFANIQIQKRILLKSIVPFPRRIYSLNLAARRHIHPIKSVKFGGLSCCMLLTPMTRRLWYTT